MDFRDNDALMREIEADMKDIVADLGIEVLEMMRDSVSTNVYLAYQPQQYERSPSGKGFLASWEDQEIQNGLNEISIIVHSDPTKMIYDPKKFQHGNEWVDRRDNMDELIQEGYGYDFMNIYSDFPRDYFNPVLDELDGNKFNMMVIRKLHHYGINNFQFKI